MADRHADRIAADRIAADWIAVDWGGSHLRLWVMDGGGRVLDRRRSDRGADRLAPGDFEPALLDLIGDTLPRGRATPVICCGMAGARRGWAEAPRRAVPCPPGGIAGAARPATADPRLEVHLLPGLCQPAPADVMRGAETRIAGWLAAHPDFDGVLCLPGARCRWAHLSAGEVVSFRSFMTGEMFALLSRHSILRHSVAAEGLDGAVFAEAVAHAMSRPAAVAGDLFAIRARSLLADPDPVAARSRLSGLLIGIELAGARPYWLGRDVAVVGTGPLADAYEAALAAQGLTARRGDGEEATLNGLRAAHAELAGRR